MGTMPTPMRRARIRAQASMRRRVVVDRNGPVDAVFPRRIVARSLVVRAPVVPDDDIALLPLVAILVGWLHHEGGHLVDDRVALGGVQAFDAQNLVLVEIKQLAAGFR